MRKIGKGKVSVSRMKEKEEKERLWKLLSLHTGVVAGVVAYFSLIINILKILQVSELTQNIVGLVMGIIALALIGWSGWYKKLDRFPNKSKVQDILDTFSLCGIFGFSIEKIINILPLQEIGLSDKGILVFMNGLFLILPIAVMIAIGNQKEWKYRVD